MRNAYQEKWLAAEKEREREAARRLVAQETRAAAAQQSAAEARIQRRRNPYATPNEGASGVFSRMFGGRGAGARSTPWVSDPYASGGAIKRGELRRRCHQLKPLGRVGEREGVDEQRARSLKRARGWSG